MARGVEESTEYGVAANRCDIPIGGQGAEACSEVWNGRILARKKWSGCYRVAARVHATWMPAWPPRLIIKLVKASPHEITLGPSAVTNSCTCSCSKTPSSFHGLQKSS